MIRKLITIPEELNVLIGLTAKKENKTEAEVVREKLRAGFATTKPAQADGGGLMAIVRRAEEEHITSDDPYLSVHIDTYLYEDP